MDLPVKDAREWHWQPLSYRLDFFLNHVVVVKYMCSQAKNIFLFYTPGLPLCIFIEQMEVTIWFSVITATEQM